MDKSELSGKIWDVIISSCQSRITKTAGEEVGGRLLPLHVVACLGHCWSAAGQKFEKRWVESEEETRSCAFASLSVSLSFSHYRGEWEQAGNPHWHIYICVLPHLNRITIQEQWPCFTSSFEFLCTYSLSANSNPEPCREGESKEGRSSSAQLTKYKTTTKVCPVSLFPKRVSVRLVFLP